MELPPLKLKDLAVSPPLFLAPMAGLTHTALRRIILGFGGVGLLSTEMLSAIRLPSDNPAISPFLARAEEEQPLSYQLLLSRISDVAPALDKLHRLKADAIDLNLGCPAPTVRRLGAGSRLMEEPAAVQALVAEVRRRTPLPLTAKIRLGEELDAAKLVGFAKMLEDEGLDLLSVHARLRGEPFCRRPRWDWVGKVKSSLTIPVIANGGIASVDDARRCLAESGADGLMIGRAAARKPWLFAEIAREVYGADIPAPAVQPAAVYLDFYRLLVESFRPERRLGRLKEFTHYFAKNYIFGHQLASAVQSSQSMDQAYERATGFLAKNGDLPRGDTVLPA